MPLSVPPIASRPETFGKRANAVFHASLSEAKRPVRISDDLRLFGLTFAGGFIVVSVLIA